MKSTFLRRFIANPRAVGSVMPSSETLARSMLRELPLGAARVVAELGPGTGTFTKLILSHLSPGAELVAFEIDHVFAATLRDQYPRVHVIEDSAEHMAKHVAALGHDAVDVVVSGLPFANLSLEFRARVLAAAQEVLRPGGHFVTYQYMHARAFSDHLESSIRSTFTSVDKRFIMANMPPAFIFHARA